MLGVDTIIEIFIDHHLNQKRKTALVNNNTI